MLASASMHKAVIPKSEGGSDPSIMLCDGLRRFARNDAESSFASIPRHLLRAITVPVFARRTNFFIIFVDGIFTTFIAGLFTNTPHAIRENHAASCV